MELLEGVNNARYGRCDVCGNQGTIFWVLGSEKEYRVRKGGVTYTGHLDGGELVRVGRGEVVQGRSKAKEREVGESIPATLKVQFESTDNDDGTFNVHLTDAKVEIPLIEDKKDEVPEADDAVAEVVVPPEPQTSGAEPEVPEGAPVEEKEDEEVPEPEAEAASENVTDTHEEQKKAITREEEIAALKAQLAELEGNEEE